MSNNWWKEPDVGVPGSVEWCAAARMWRAACGALGVAGADESWARIVDASPPDTIWHSLRNCVAYQAGVWQNLLQAGGVRVRRPAAFQLAVVLRHSPSHLAARLLTDILRDHPRAQELTQYVLTLLTDDEPTWCGSCGAGEPRTADDTEEETGRCSVSPSSAPAAEAEANGVEADGAESEPLPQPRPEPAPEAESGSEAAADAPQTTADESASGEPAAAGGGAGGAESGAGGAAGGGGVPRRDALLFGDCELAVLAASREEYDAHAKLVRAEYRHLAHRNYVELRVKVLNQLAQVPKLYHTPEFECFEQHARENIDREITTLREHLLTGRGE